MIARTLADRARLALVELSRAHLAPAPRPDGERLRFLFTIDTEISMGGATRDPSRAPVGARRRIWAETGEGLFGITRFMDLFDAHGLRGVFFFEPVARAVVSPGELEEAARCIADRGHDVELHVHPEFEMDLPKVQRGEAKSPSALLYAHALGEQRRYIAESLDCLERWTGRRPIAFRAGGYSASEETMRALVAEGISVDSSYNKWAVDRDACGMKATPPLNDAAMLAEGLLEVPVTNLRDAAFSGLIRLAGAAPKRASRAGPTRLAKGPRGGLKPMELSALNASEVIAALEQLYEAGARTACCVTHSFRLVRARDVQYTDAVPDAFNLHRLRVLCRYLAEHRDRFEVCTFRDLPLARWRNLPAPGGAPFYPTPPAWSSIARLAVQAIKDRGAQ